MSIEQKTRLYYFENRFSLLFFAFSSVIMVSVLLRRFAKALAAALWGDSNIENFNEIDSVLIGYHTFLRIPSLFQVIFIVNFVFLIFTVFRNYKFKIQNIAKKSYSLLDKIEIALKALLIVLSFVCIVYVLGFDIFEYRFFQGQNNLLIILPLMMNFNTLGCSSFATNFAMEFLYFMLVINLFFFLSVLVVNGIKKEKNYIFESIAYSLMLPYLIYFIKIEYFLSLTGLSSINYAFFNGLFNCLISILLLPFPLFFIYRKYKDSDSKTFLKDSIKSTIIVGSIVTISILFNLIIFIIVNKFDNPSELILCFKDNYHLNISERLIAPVFFISIPPLVSLVWALINYHRQSNTNTIINN